MSTVKDIFAKQFEYDCCKNCNNNPKNNTMASGNCSCILPILEYGRKLNVHEVQTADNISSDKSIEKRTKE